MEIDKIICECTRKIKEYVNCNVWDMEKKEELKKEIYELKGMICTYSL